MSYHCRGKQPYLREVKRYWPPLVVFCTILLNSPSARADWLSDLGNEIESYYESWMRTVHHTHEYEQPDWMTPLVTVIPTLQQEIRTDFFFTDAPHNVETYNYLTKGTEIIPSENTEIILGNPNYVTRSLPNGATVSGFADWTFLAKYRILSSPSDDGNYVLMFLLGTSYATGKEPYFTAGHDLFNPMLGFGKGFEWDYGEFDYQATIGPTVPDGGMGKLGTPVTWNSVFQYRIRVSTPFLDAKNQVSTIWPEFETTWTSFPNGADVGQQQLYLTAGFLAGRFNLGGYAHFVLGMGYQFAVTESRLYNHQFLVSMRIPYY
jgi:hypothetical protein